MALSQNRLGAYFRLIAGRGAERREGEGGGGWGRGGRGWFCYST